MAFSHLSPIYLLIIPPSYSLDSPCDLYFLYLALFLLLYPLYLCCSLANSFCSPTSSFHFPRFPCLTLVSCLAHAALSLSLVLPSRKSLSTICLAVMNSEPFRTNQLGQINETLQRDKLYVTVRVRVGVCT